MAEVAVSKESVKAVALPDRRAVAFALAVGVISVCWFISLGNWLGVRPGTVLMTHQNVLFDSDTSLWIERMIGNSRSTQQSVHPLEILLWRFPCRALAHLAALVMPREYASLLGPSLLVALFAASGVGFLAYLASYLGVPRWHSVLLFGSYLLFTINATVALPEHYGISNGLLTLAFVVLIVVASERLRNAVLVALAAMCGGTSLINALFPLYCLFEAIIKSARVKLRLLIAAVPAGVASLFVLHRISGNFGHYFDYWLNLRLFRAPVQAFIYSVYLLAAPAVGPKPFMKSPEWQGVTYDPVSIHASVTPPLDFSHYYHIQAIGAIIWLVLLIRCVHIGLRDNQTRRYAQMALLWILFSLFFYNLWGREPFLNSSAWSWSLMALVILGARRLSLTFVAATVIPIAICQVVTLREIGNLLQIAK